MGWRVATGRLVVATGRVAVLRGWLAAWLRGRAWLRAVAGAAACGGRRAVLRLVVRAGCAACR
ncbi:hypothetical protein, partial [Falsiroseomonas sp.]|uniref:hypothetical protein n=1 Tax=Falsiroseomonas sp. TaxID=2870721 RepID=UPI0034A49670